MSAYFGDRICASVPSDRVDREEGNALVGRSPPMMDPYSTRVNAPRIRPWNEPGVGGWDALSFSERDKSFRDIPPTDRDSSAAETSDCSKGLLFSVTFDKPEELIAD